MIDVNVGIKLHNRFDAVLTDAKTGEVKQIAKAENVVTNYYWDNCLTTNMYLRLALGTGTGTPSVNDTDLFTYLGRWGVNFNQSDGVLQRTSPTTWTHTWTRTATENQANGDLTEVGFGRGYGGESDGWLSDRIASLYTHALFTDAENNPIVIHKTNSDRLTLMATLYLTLEQANDPSNGVYMTINHRTASNSTVNCDPRVPFVNGDSYYLNPIYMWMIRGSSLANSIYVDWNSLPTFGSSYKRSYLFNNSEAATSYTYDYSTMTVSNKLINRALSTALNCTTPSTYLIRSIDNIYSFVTLPNANVYPARLLTLTQTADGTNTNFNFGIPILNTNNAKVYINNVLQSSSAYTFNGNDFTHPQGWGSYDTLYLSKYTWFKRTGSSSVAVYHIGPVSLFPETGNYQDNFDQVNEYYYDFKTPYTVSAVGRLLMSGYYMHSTELPRLFYSGDNENWTELALWGSRDAYRNAANITNGSYLQVNPVSARYWKVVNPYIGYTSEPKYISRYLLATILFGDPKPQLQFTTAPPADATVKIEAYCDYPIKNENWIIENSMTFDYKITRL